MWEIGKNSVDGNFHPLHLISPILLCVVRPDSRRFHGQCDWTLRASDRSSVFRLFIIAAIERHLRSHFSTKCQTKSTKDDVTEALYLFRKPVTAFCHEFFLLIKPSVIYLGCYGRAAAYPCPEYHGFGHPLIIGVVIELSRCNDGIHKTGMTREESVADADEWDDDFDSTPLLERPCS